LAKGFAILVFLSKYYKYLQLEKEIIMALTSPGVEVTVIDESQYIPSAVNTVPYFLIATAQNKVSSDGITVAAGTLAANANKTYLITSQRDLAATFGVPFFYNTTTGTPINGYELNEYGLLAAYSALGVTNRCYVQRADIDLTALTASLTRPTGAASNGAYWLDTSTSTWGIFEWSAVTETYTNKVPLIINDTADVENFNNDIRVYPGGTTDYTPLQSIGSIGDYAVVACSIYTPVYFKNYNNDWVQVGTNEWKASWYTVAGTNAPTSLPASSQIIINDITVTVITATVTGLAATINGTVALQNLGITARAVSNVLYLYGTSASSNDTSSLSGDGIITIDPGVTSGTQLLTALGLTAGEYACPQYYPGYSYQQPKWITGQDLTATGGPRPTGSVWQNLSVANNGIDIVTKQYSAALATWIPQSCPLYNFDSTANYYLDPTGGGKNIPVGTLYAQYSVLDWDVTPYTLAEPTASFTVLERYALGATVVTGSNVVSTGTPFAGMAFNIIASVAGSPSGTFNSAIVTIGGTGTAADFVTAVSAQSASIPGITAAVNSAGKIVMSCSYGGTFSLQNYSGTPLAAAGFSAWNPTTKTGTVGIRPSTTVPTQLICSNWVQAPTFTYTSSNTTPDQDPADGRVWYYSSVSDADIMIQNDGSWMGYQNVSNDVRGYDLTVTNATGPIISATAPTTQTDAAASPLVYGDLWIDTSDLENYPKLYRWQQVSGVDQWVEIDTTDQTTQNGILFADIRWATNGTTDPVADPFPSITDLLTSDYHDPDQPDATLYAQGTLLFNTRRSGYNVKTFQMDYFTTTATDYTIDAYSTSTSYVVNDFVSYNSGIYVCVTATSGAFNSADWDLINLNTWLTASGNKSNGAMWSGRLAQRQMVVQALKSGIDTSVTAREEQTQFNIIATPAYPELTPNMIALSNERNNTLFVVGDTPMRLGPDGTSLVAFATNNGGLGQPNGDGNIATSNYCGVFYPSCQTTDLGGNVVVQPPSHMMVRTILRSDAASYPWFAPAGTRRGVVDNALAIGYIAATTGEFNQIGVSQSVRDILYARNINPITFIPGIGITNFGNKTSTATTTALDRINVARLVCFLRGRLEEIGKLYLFEPNDTITRNQITNTVNSLMIDLVAKRALYDYLVVCDLSNNTPARIDRSELWVDIAIEPVKAVEFVYIPLRIKNTGAIAAGQ